MGGFFLVAAGHGQGAVDVAQFLLAQKILQRPQGLGQGKAGAGRELTGADGKADGLGRAELRESRPTPRCRRRGVAADGGGQIGHPDGAAFAQGAGAFDGVFQFAHVAGPIVGGEHVQGLAGDLKELAGAGIDLVAQEMDGQDRDVLAALAQAGQVDGDDVEAVDRGPREMCLP